MKSHKYAIQHLKEVYWGFVQSLEPPLAKMALTYYHVFSPRQLVGGQGPSAQVGDSVPVDIQLPFMLAEVFRLSRDDQFAIASGGMFGLFAVSLYDAMFDRQLPVEPDRLLLQHLLSAKMLSYWCALFNQDSLFWGYHRAYFGEYYRAISAERERYCGRISAYDEEDLHEIARGKSAPRKILLAAMAIRDGSDALERIETLSASLDACAVADQIIDDISDWEEDFSDRRFSYLLTRVITSYGLESRISVGAYPTPMRMMLYVLGSGEPQILLDEARTLFQKAIRCVEGLECPEWKQFLRDRMKLCAEIKHNIEARL